jgi:hypothetical protein
VLDWFLRLFGGRRPISLNLGYTSILAWLIPKDTREIPIGCRVDYPPPASIRRPVARTGGVALNETVPFWRANTEEVREYRFESIQHGVACYAEVA